MVTVWLAGLFVIEKDCALQITEDETNTTRKVRKWILIKSAHFLNEKIKKLKIKTYK